MAIKSEQRDPALEVMAMPVSRNTFLALVAIVGISVAIRVALAIYYGDSFGDFRGGTYDQVSYDALAQRVLAGDGFSFARDWWPYARANQPTAFWSYLYTMYLAAVYAVFGNAPFVARLIQSVAVGVLMPLALYVLGRQVFGSRAGLIAAAIAALYLYFVNYAASLMSEAFYITLIPLAVAVAIWLMDRIELPVEERRWLVLGLGALFGLLMALAILLRQVVAVYFAALLVFMLLNGWRRRKLKRIAAPIVAAGLVMLALFSPVLVRNYQAFGQMTSLNTNSGFAFFWANHPIYGTQFEAVLDSKHGVSYQDLIPAELRHLNEAELDRALLSRGLDFVADEPIRYVKLSLSRIPIYFLFWPTADSTFTNNAARVLSFALVLPFAVYGLILAFWRLAQGLFSQRGDVRPSDGQEEKRLLARNVFVLVGFLVLYSAIHIVSWANVRYRLPVDAFLIIFAAYGIDDLFRRIRQANWRTKERTELGVVRPGVHYQESRDGV